MRILLVTLLLAVSALAQEKPPAAAPAQSSCGSTGESSRGISGEGSCGTRKLRGQKAPAAAPEKAPAPAPEKAPAPAPETPAAASQRHLLRAAPEEPDKASRRALQRELRPKDVENFEIHAVVVGDTLSGISKEVLKDGKLWPQIWEQNEHVVNPHWIYPNDKILIRPVTKISEARPPPSQRRQDKHKRRLLKPRQCRTRDLSL
jgi:hypothetical protein